MEEGGWEEGGGVGEGRGEVGEGRGEVGQVFAEPRTGQSSAVEVRGKRLHESGPMGGGDASSEEVGRKWSSTGRGYAGAGASVLAALAELHRGSGLSLLELSARRRGERFEWGSAAERGEQVWDGEELFPAKKPRTTVEVEVERRWNRKEGAVAVLAPRGSDTSRTELESGVDLDRGASAFLQEESKSSTRAPGRSEAVVHHHVIPTRQNPVSHRDEDLGNDPVTLSRPREGATSDANLLQAQNALRQAELAGRISPAQALELTQELSAAPGQKGYGGTQKGSFPSFWSSLTYFLGGPDDSITNSPTAFMCTINILHGDGTRRQGGL